MVKVICVSGGRTYGRLAIDEPPTDANLARIAKERQALVEAIEREAIWSKPDDFGNRLPTGTRIIHGGALGADRISDDWAVTNWVPMIEFKADWDSHKKKAGILRNLDLVYIGKPNVIIAAKGGRGTQHMVNLAITNNIRLVKVGW